MAKVTRKARRRETLLRVRKHIERHSKSGHEQANFSIAGMKVLVDWIDELERLSSSRLEKLRKARGLFEEAKDNFRMYRGDD